MAAQPPPFPSPLPFPLPIHQIPNHMCRHGKRNIDIAPTTTRKVKQYFPLLSSFSIEIQMCLEGSTLAFVCQLSSFGVSARAPHSTCRCCSPPFGVSLSLKFCLTEHCELCAGAHASRVCKVFVQLTVSAISYALYLCLPFAICHLFV